MQKQLNYVLRTLSHGRGANLIKVVSLGLGLTMSILLFSRVAYEQSFDTHYRDVDRLYQVWSQFTINGEALPWQEQNVGPLAGAILENFPRQVEAATSLSQWIFSSPFYMGRQRIDADIVTADSLFFRTMGIEVLEGDANGGLAQPEVMFLSKSLARKVFGEASPVGKTLNYNHEFELTVRGVYTDFPENSTLKTEAVISLPTAFKHTRHNYSWQGGDSWKEYIRLKPGADPAELNQRMADMIAKYLPTEDKRSYSYAARVAPIRDTYRGYDQVSRMSGIMSVLGFAILFIVSLNYVLISISSLSRRAKAVGVHKCSGAEGGTILSMFLVETLVVILLALLLMGALLWGFRDVVEDTACASLASLFAPARLWVPLAVLAVLFVVGGVLPGLQFARIPVTQVFRRYTEGKKTWKRPLLFVQFAGVAFICGLMCVVTAQYHHVMNRDMGYRPDRIALADLYVRDSTQRAAIEAVLKGLPYVEAVTSAHSTPIWNYSGMMIPNEAGQAAFSTRYSGFMRSDYPEFMGMKFKQGRMATDWHECVVNETFAERMHWGDEVVGRWLPLAGERYKVVGLLQNFVIGGFYNEPLPFLAIYNKAFYGTIHVKLREPFADNLERLKHDVAEAFPMQTIDFLGYDREIASRYNSVRVFRNATFIAAVTMFFVMLMGLIGYTADEVHRRSKEIAIRKVNGAGVGDILRLLARDVWVVALPAVLTGMVSAWYVNNQWIAAFAERISVSPFTYLLLFVAVVAVIMACVLLKSLAIAHENPVKSIKSE